MYANMLYLRQMRCNLLINRIILSISNGNQKLQPVAFDKKKKNIGTICIVPTPRKTMQGTLQPLNTGSNRGRTCNNCQLHIIVNYGTVSLASKYTL